MAPSIFAQVYNGAAQQLAQLTRPACEEAGCPARQDAREWADRFPGRRAASRTQYGTRPTKNAGDMPTGRLPDSRGALPGAGGRRAATLWASVSPAKAGAVVWVG